jgi:hypothetical protein
MTGVRVPGMEMPWNPDTHLLWAQITQIYSNRLKFFVSPYPETLVTLGIYPSVNQEFFFQKGKIVDREKVLPGLTG